MVEMGAGWPPPIVDRPYGGTAQRKERPRSRRIAKALILIVDQSQGGGGDQQWKEWPGAARTLSLSQQAA
jgi:hypothetical protein